MTVPAPHNLTLMGNSSGIVELMQSVNSNLMQDTFGILLLTAFFLILLLTFVSTTNNGGKSFIAASFATFLISIPLRILGLIPDLALYGVLAIAAFAVAIVKTRE